MSINDSGTFSRLSTVVRGRKPLGQDDKLDYSVDSDDEWEEEEPGNDDTPSHMSWLMNVQEMIVRMKPVSLKVRTKKRYTLVLTMCCVFDSLQKDGFIVEDDYLSENEGVDVDRVAHSAEVIDVDELPTSPAKGKKKRRVKKPQELTAISVGVSFVPIANGDIHLSQFTLQPLCEFPVDPFAVKQSPAEAQESPVASKAGRTLTHDDLVEFVKVYICSLCCIHMV